ncbi:organic solute transporter subunit alpha [Hyperolius riggenbachi]|uniref:organic solute transporter subunit alpha n=1 Tax=Hyperolius riggenbachi TaxID=752182 RepID=UPI0035A29FCF
MASQHIYHLDPRLPSQFVNAMLNNSKIHIACLSLPPTAAQLPYMLNTAQLCIMGVLTTLATISLILYVEEVVYFAKKVRCPVKRRTNLWSSAAPTLIAVFSCLGLWIPRSAMYIDLIINTYFAVCFYLILMVFIEGFGGKDAIVKKFESTDVHINTGPCCCCCLCLRPIRLTKKNVNLLVLGVFQLAFLKPVFNIIGVILFADGIYNVEDLSSKSIALWMNVSLGFSTVIALWPIGILFRHAKAHLKDYNVGKKYAIFQLLLILTTVQSSIINIVGSSGVLPCVPPYSFRARGFMMNSQLLIIETFLLSVLARFAYRKKDDEAGYIFKPLAV